MKLILTLALACVFFQASAQDNPDKIYAFKEYSKAARLLEAKQDKSLDDMTKIANSYRLNHDTRNAEFWYRQVIDKSKEPIHLFYYAQALHSNGDFAKAKEFYLAYDEKLGGELGDVRGKRLAEAIDHLSEMRFPGKIEVLNVENLNSAQLDFSPTYFGDGILFVSSRGNKQKKSLHDNWIDDNFMNLYYAYRDNDDDFLAPKLFSGNVNTDYHEGPLSMDKSGKQIFFSQNQQKNGRRINAKDGLMKNNIYTAYKTDNTWSEVTEMKFNTKEYEELHPAISPDGATLIFSSDRPGGHGGMDLYAVRFEEGKWTEPKNLGPQFNTNGNEVFPFIHDDNNLYFASDGWGGLGGLDLFKRPIEDKRLKVVPKNLGSPINSQMDDFGLSMNILGNEGFFSSDREGGKGKDDIYKFVLNEISENDLSALNTFCFFDGDSGQRLNNVEVTIFEIDNNDAVSNLMPYFDQKESEISSGIPQYVMTPSDKNNQELENLTTGRSGDFKVQLVKARKYFMSIEREGYKSISKEFSIGENGEFDFSNCIPLEKSNCLTVNGTVVDANTNEVIPMAKIEVIETCLGDKLEIITDENGKYEFPCTICNCEYLIKASKETYAAAKKSSGATTSKCLRGGTITVDLELESKKKKAEIAVGTSLELRNIFYDFDKDFIRRTASTDLYKLVRLMKTYPSMIIELSSHTDSRGTVAYNIDLSQRRAQSAVDFLVSQGIPSFRLQAKGYGESRIRNLCKNGVKCSEEEHQLNRRTEISILQLNEPIEVKHIDNWPIIVR